MLIQFNFDNFKSFKDETSVDLSATKISEHPNHVVNFGKEKLLKILAIYGANASGKSNIYDAFYFMTNYVLNSFKYGGDDFEDLNSLNQRFNPILIPFLFDEENKNKESNFEVFFIDKEDNYRVYQYGFSLKNNIVLEEWLFSRAKTSKDYKTIFYREKGKEIDFTGLDKKSSENLRVALENETLIVSLGSKLKVEKLKKVRDWFASNEFIDFGNPLEDFILSRLSQKIFVDDESIQKNIVNYLSTFDESIIGFKVNKYEIEGSTNYEIFTKHKSINNDSTITIPLEHESSGTLKMLCLYPHINKVLEQGSTLFIDEINARLHPLLVRNIILTFSNPDININNAQLVFTTHDSWQLSNDLLRRDEVLFVDKQNGISEAYSLSEFVTEEGNKIRKDEDFNKNYLIGKYGAIPKLKPMSIFNHNKDKE